tara:strand:+ start:67 stop:633 length:567 start_codon:yes stop_codon:yes gene_type:complete
MKTVILAMILMMGFTSLGQEINIFKESTVDAKKLQKFAVQIDSAYVVEVPNKSAIEIFQMVEIAVASQWVNPDEVISGKLEGKYLKINGGGPSIGLTMLGTPYYYSSVLRYHFKFKDGKFMYEVEALTRVPASQYSSGGLYPTFLTTHNKRGVEDKLSTRSISSINYQINSFISSIINGVEESEDESW